MRDFEGIGNGIDRWSGTSSFRAKRRLTGALVFAVSPHLAGYYFQAIHQPECHISIIPGRFGIRKFYILNDFICVNLNISHVRNDSQKESQAYIFLFGTTTRYILWELK